jgi:uncharacterized protein YggE
MVIVTAMKRSAAPNVPVSSGQLTVGIDVNGIYELAK